MAQTFSTWTEALAWVESVILSGNPRVGSIAIGDKVIRYRNFDDLIKYLGYFKTQAALESGSASLRSYGKQGGRASS